jgi:hypothetical protein
MIQLHFLPHPYFLVGIPECWEPYQFQLHLAESRLLFRIPWRADVIWPNGNPTAAPTRIPVPWSNSLTQHSTCDGFTATMANPNWRASWQRTFLITSRRSRMSCDVSHWLTSWKEVLYDVSHWLTSWKEVLYDVSQWLTSRKEVLYDVSHWLTS